MPQFYISENRHPVDKLSDIREAVKELKKLEEVARNDVLRLMGDTDSVNGEQFLALRTFTERKGNVDESAMKEAGINPDQYRKPSSTSVGIKISAREFGQ